MEQESSTKGTSTEEQVILETHDEIAILRLGLPSEKVITLTEKRLQSFIAALTDVKQSKEIKGLVLMGAYPKLFCAGADINDIRDVVDAKKGAELAQRGQTVFDAIADLDIPTIAAVMGPCVGGGCEMVLACDYRLLVDGFGTRIGLPEVKLGIIPGFGGTQRLPRLVGLPKALPVILKGQVLEPQQARSIHLCDELLEADSDPDKTYVALENRAKSLIRNPSLMQPQTISLKDRILTYTALGRSLVYPRAKESVLASTQGHYPAPLMGLESAVFGLRHGMKKGLRYEAETIGKLIVSPESKALIHVHRLTEQAGKLGKAGKAELKDLKLGVVGGGTMGAGIAAACIVSGVPVVLVEPDAKQRERAQTRVKAALSYKRSLSEHQRSEYLKNISICDNIEDLKSCSFLIEAVYEDFDVKREVLGRLAAIVDQDCIIATNTSSLPIRILAEGLDSADRVIGMHFFNPAERMPLVEIVVGRESSNRSIALTAALCSMLGKYPVVVQDVPGFLVNRVLSPYFLETGFLLGDGASPDQIDKQALAFGMPMGPVRLLDEVGLDIAAKVASVMHESYGPRMEGPLFAAQLTEQGRLGRKNGKGFYRFDGDDWYPDSEVEKMLGLSFDSSKNSAEDIQDRLFLSMVNEAVRCLDEAVAGESGSEAAGQIDLASVMGTGFAPFRGGLMHYADNLGAPEVMKRMVRLMELHGERFAPAKGIRIRADEKLSFYDAV